MMNTREEKDVGEPQIKRLKVDQQDEGSHESKQTNENVTVATPPTTEKDEMTTDDAANKNSVLTESDVGIQEYMNSHDGFHAVIKQRYSDFLVNEISTDGDVVHLTDITSIPEKDAGNSQPADSGVLSEEDRAKLQNLYDTKDKTAAVKLMVDDDKEKRTQVHKFIRENFSGLNSSTLDEGDAKVIQVTWQKGRDNRQSREQWPTKLGNYIKFVLYKENMDTMAAINLLGKFLRVKPGLFAYAGTKDKRAKTSQNITVYRVDPEKLQNLNNQLRGVGIGNFRYCKQPLKLGSLKGNRFHIVLRNVSGTDSQIDLAMKSLKEAGFINYFGMQRFGTTSVATHHIGRALLLSKWKEAVELILKPRDRCGDDDISECRRIWWESRDAKAALKKLQQKFCIEKQLLQGLNMYGDKDLVGALTMIPRNTRLMYVHSHQSYIWNTLVSRRIKQLGRKPIVGDLVIPSQRINEEERPKPQVVTEENQSDWTLQDVVMPLPGYDVQYPSNQVAEWYKEMLSQDGLDINSLKHKVRDYSLPGNYRHIIVEPQDVQWTVEEYSDVTRSLVLSDLDKLRSVSLEKETESQSDCKFKSLKIELSLPSSTYATMALREVLKEDTSAAHQTTLNVT